MSKFKIGDRVSVKNYKDIPEEFQSKGIARMCGERGVVEDVFFSEANSSNLYIIKFDNFEKSTKLWHQDMLNKVENRVTYFYEIECLDNIVLARFYETHDDNRVEIAKGHGHIIHEGALGVAQAASYALKRIYYDISNTEG